MASVDCVGWRFWYNAAMDLTVLQPSRVTVMIKPVGALCNLDCTYCYYLPTKEVYGGHERRMGLDTLRNIFASILPRFADEVTIAWQGGEPTLAGLDFFRHAIALQNQYARPTQRFHHALQTNGTLLDDEWCKFLHDNEFLIGLSVDGPPRFHDHYRLTNRQGPSSDLVLQGLRLLQKHGVEYNILCVLNNVNVDHPEEVLHYLLNLGSRWLQFIPAVEWEKDPIDPNRNILASYSPDPEAYGRFLCRVFDLWFERYRKRVSIRLFDAVLNKLVLGQMPFCILDGSCHNQLTIEHDGAVFGCDHFVERRWQLGQIGQPGWSNPIQLDGSTEVGLTVHGTGYRKLESHSGRDIDRIADVADVASSVTHDTNASSSTATATATANDGVDEAWLDRLEGARLGAFAARKQNLPAKCKACEWKAFCHGGCPKHRSQGGDVPEPTVLCQSYMMFYGHAMPRLNWLAGYLRQDQQPPDPEWASETGASRAVASPAGVVPGSAPRAGRGATPGAVPGAVPGARPGVPGVPGVARVSSSGPGRNDPCPCGSGLKYKKCHGKNL